MPTLLAGATVVEMAKDPTSHLLPPQRAKALTVGPQMHDMAVRARKGGVKVAFGTDTGVSKHGDNAKEFALMVAAGFTPMEAIRAATVNAADHLGKVRRPRDRSRPESSPTSSRSIRTRSPMSTRYLDVDFVMKDGVAFKTPD